jgi:hypothetical protein
MRWRRSLAMKFNSTLRTLPFDSHRVRSTAAPGWGRNTTLIEQTLQKQSPTKINVLSAPRSHQPHRGQQAAQTWPTTCVVGEPMKTGHSKPSIEGALKTALWNYKPKPLNLQGGTLFNPPP